MKSLVGSLVGALTNRAPVPLVSKYSAAAMPTIFQSGNDDVRLMDAYANSGTVFAIVSRIATAVSSVEWCLYRKAASGLDEDRMPVTAHAALDLLNRPNAFMTRQRLFEVAQQHLDLTGESDLLVSALGKIPYELWPARPDRVDVVPDPYDFIAGYVYTSPDGERIPLDTAEVMQLLMPNPLDPYRGLGPVQSILVDIDSGRYSSEWNRNFFLNSAEPGGIIEVDRRLDDDEFREMTARWQEQHRGVSKAHRVALIEAGAKWIDRNVSQKDMQFTELSTLSRDKILEAFGFPKSMLGIVEDVNRANAEASEYMFSKWLVVPRLERWKGLLNTMLLPRYSGGDRLEFDYESPVPENSDQDNAALTARWDAVSKVLPLGFDSEELLEALGLPAVAFAAPPPSPAPAIAPPPPAADPAMDPAQMDEGLSDELRASLAEWREFMAAQKWETVVHEDDNTCEPCLGQKGKTYRNREDAYDDYPDGKGYKDCVGAEFGNSCRCTVRKRKRSA